MEKITFSLPKTSLSMVTKNTTIDGYVYDTLDSTNNKAWELSLHQHYQKTDSLFFVIAKEQTKGKGQRGKTWHSDKGGLYVSLYLPINLPVNNSHHLTLFTASGIVQQLRKYQIQAELKWLNDLILHGKKLGGILAETKVVNQKIYQAVIGVGINYQNSNIAQGINLNDHLSDDDRSDDESQFTNLLDYHQEINLYRMVVQGVITGYQKYLTIGIEEIVNDYNQLLYNLNQTVSIEKNQGQICGCDTNGNLLVKISSENATSNVRFSPEKYRISYEKINNHYLITEIDSD